VKIYLLYIDSVGALFYNERVEDSTDDARRERARAWIERQYRRFRKSVRAAENGVGARFRRLERWLEGRISPEETLLRRLRHASTIELVYPSAMAEGEAQKLWRGYLARQRRAHLKWFVIDLLIAPLTLLLMPLPGPNIIGYWFIYRALCHLLAVIGARRAMKAPLELVAADILNPKAKQGDEEWMRELADACGLKGLRRFIRRAKPLPASGAT
jgi:hypothetical protein